MAQTNPMASLATLLKLQSPSNVATLKSPKQWDIATGMDALGPTDAELEDQQHQDANQMMHMTGGAYSHTPSKESLYDDGMQALRRSLKLGSIQHQMDMEKATTPEIIKGEYGVKQAEATGRAQGDRLKFTQDAMGSRQEANQNAIMARLNVTQSGANARQEDAQAFKAGNVNPAAMTAIANERKSLAAAQAKNAPGALGRLFGKSDPYKAQLDTFDNTLGYAQKILREHPEASAEEALAAMGQQPSPEELGQIQKFLLLLRGH